MGKIIAVHSFRGGTGKTNLAANMAVCLAASGRRVCVVDADIHSPGIHTVFGQDPKKAEFTLNDFLWGKCSMEEAAEDISPSLVDDQDMPVIRKGALYLVPSSNKLGEILKILKGDHDIKRLKKGYTELVESLNLDVLLLDTHPGLNEETLLSMSISDTLLILLRPDTQDFQGTALSVEVARKLNLPEMFLAMNKVLPEMDFDNVRSKMERTYEIPVAGLLPLSTEMARLGSKGIFCVREPEHAVAREIQAMAGRLMEEKNSIY